MSESKEYAIKIENLTKEYKMYDKKIYRLLEILLPRYQKHKAFKAVDNMNLEIENANNNLNHDNFREKWCR